MKKLLISIFILSSVFSYDYERYEDSMNDDEIKHQRVYTSKHIYNLISKLTYGGNCNAKIKNDGLSFTITKDTHYFQYINRVYDDPSRSSLNSYECMLSSDKLSLQCERRLPGGSNEVLQMSNEYIQLIINLDKNGNAISMKGRKSKMYDPTGTPIPLSITIPILEIELPLVGKVITEFECKAKPATLEKDEENDQPRGVNNKQIVPSDPPARESGGGTAIR